MTQWFASASAVTAGGSCADSSRYSRSESDQSHSLVWALWRKDLVLIRFASRGIAPEEVVPISALVVEAVFPGGV